MFQYEYLPTHINALTVKSDTVTCTCAEAMRPPSHTM